MWNNMTNFLSLIRGRKIKTTLEDTDLIAIATKDPTFDGGYQPTAVTVEDFIASIPIPVGGVQSVDDNGGGGVAVDNTDPINPVIGFTGVFVDGTMSGTGVFGNPLTAAYQPPSVDGVTITGNGTPGNPLVSVADGVQSVTGLDTDNTDPLNPIVQISVDGTTITGDGTPGNPLVAAGGGAVNYGNVFFVDSTNGFNATAAQNDFTKAWQDFGSLGVLLSTLTPTATNRNLVYVRRGLYTGSSIVLYNYTDYYFEPGTVIDSACVFDNGASVTCSIFGKARFTGTVPAFSNDLFRLTGTASNVYFEFDDLFSDRAAFGIFNGSSATIVGRKVFSETFNTGYGCTFRGSGTIVVNITEELAAWHQVISVRAFSGKLYVTCPRMYLHEGNYYGGDFKQVISLVDSLGGEVVLNGDLIVNPIAGYYGGISGVITRWTDSFGTIRLNGNIYAENQFGVYGLGSSGASRTIINGDVKTNNLAAYVASNSSVVFRNGTLLNNNTTTGSEGFPVVSMGGSGSVWVENCHVHSLGLGATYPNIAAFWKDTTTATLNVYNSVHSGADTPGFFIRNSAPAQPVNNVRILNCRATKPLDTNITDVLTPTGFTQDANIQSINFI